MYTHLERDIRISRSSPSSPIYLQHQKKIRVHTPTRSQVAEQEFLTSSPNFYLLRRSNIYNLHKEMRPIMKEIS